MIFTSVTFLITCEVLPIYITASSSKISVSRNPDDVKFYLYWNPGDVLQAEELIYLNVNSIRNSHYDPSKGIKIYSSGFLQNATSDPKIKNAYLESGFASDWNLIVVDWSELSGNKIRLRKPRLTTVAILPIYLTVVQNVEVVAKRVSNFLVFLQANDLISGGASSIHLIGQSLGSHVMGIAGMHFKNALGIQLGRITGTDPAGPLFQFYPNYKRLDSSDAAFVDILHTNQGGAGFIGRAGHADTFVNSDSLFQVQPMCKSRILRQPFCSHNVAVAYFAKSITHQRQFQAARCNVNRLLPWWLCIIFGRQEFIWFGESTPTSARGKYYINNFSADS